MTEFFSDFGLLDNIFLVCAAVGGTIFLVRLVLQLIGASHDVDPDVQADVSFDHDGGVDHADEVHADSDAGFKMLTIQGMTAFIMMFGLVGLMIKRGFGLGSILALLGACAAGAVTMWMIARAMALMIGLQSSGNIDEKNAIGEEGAVYLTIPAGGVGKVHITVQDRLTEYDAESSNKQEIKTGERIRVVFIKGENMIVEKI